MDSNQQVLMNKYDFGHKLGEGNFAKVYHGRDRESGQNVAIKVIDKNKVLKSKLIEQTKREITVMGIVKHPNVVQLYEVMATKTKIYFIMEYVKGGELFKKVAQGRLNENVARKYFIELISALDVCHNRGVYHRDLKLENLLLDENGSLKITDFGLSAVNESKQPDGLLHTTCGTPAYVAPEVIKRNGYDGDKADIWSCGVILFVMMAGYLPFQDFNIMGMYLKIYKAEYKFPNWFPSDLRKLLSKILDPNPYTRISISRIRNSSWFKKGYVNNPKIGEIADIKTPSSENDSVVATNTNVEFPKPASLNAFDIISFSSGFNLSGLFKDSKQRNEAQFTSLKPVPVIVSKLEEVFKEVQMMFVKKENGLFSFEDNEDKRGHLCIDMEIFELTPLIHLVEMKLSEGNTYEYQRILKMHIKPALKDIVCAWQGEKQRQ